jgi:nitrate reductase NapD
VVSRRDFLTLRRRSSLEGASPTDSVVHIASLLVHALPGRIEDVRAAAASIAGAELHPTPHPGKLVIALECADERRIADCINALHAAPGVLTVSVISHVIDESPQQSEGNIDGSEPT